MIATPLHSLLLVEDDPGDVFLLEEMLGEQGCGTTILKADRLSEALSLLQSSKPQIVLLDLNLPDSTGMSTLNKILEVASQTPVILLTGLSDETLGIEAVKMGAQDYLIKGEVDGRILKRSIYYALERKKLEIVLKQTLELLERQARIDYLTGIYNRVMFNELLEAERQRAIRYKSDLSLIMFDLDHFKLVNDTYGHAFGDHVLKETAKLVENNIRSHDILCRWGGEEFMVLTPGNSRVQAAELAQKLRSLIDVHDFSDDVRVTASFGVTQLSSQDKIEEFVDRADKALYQAKEHGRNRYECL